MASSAEDAGAVVQPAPNGTGGGPPSAGALPPDAVPVGAVPGGAVPGGTVPPGAVPGGAVLGGTPLRPVAPGSGLRDPEPTASIPSGPVPPGPEVTDQKALHERLARKFDEVVANVGAAYVGRIETVRLALCCLMAEGHLLVEDHPGVGKTTLAKALARSLGLGFGRVQFTADLLPADVTGAMVFDRDSGRVSFRPGPVFTNVLLADELNRASPKAQSALLESMEERQVSTDGVSHLLPRPFMVLATQNPFDAAGTFPLPHSQRDRFLLRISLGYPDRAAEDLLLASTSSRPTPESLPSVCGPRFLASFADAVRHVFVAPELRGYVLDLVHETRDHPDLTVGASPRATLALLRAAGALAVSSGRNYITPDDVKVVAEPALGHRVLVHPAAELAGVTPSATIAEIVSRIVVPVRVHR